MLLWFTPLTGDLTHFVAIATGCIAATVSLGSVEEAGMALCLYTSSFHFNPVSIRLGDNREASNRR